MRKNYNIYLFFPQDIQGTAPRFTVLPDKGHYISDIYKERDLYDWFLANKRQH
jgi:hypothetical protein